MSGHDGSSHEVLQLPSWDEFDAAVDGEDAESEHPEDAIVEEPEPCGLRSPLLVMEPSSSNSIPSASYLPGVTDDGDLEEPTGSIGPSLPPGYSLRRSVDSEGDPEDPDDPNERGNQGRLPHIRLPVGPSLPDEEMRSHQPGSSRHGSSAPPPEPMESSSRRQMVIGPSIPPDLLPFDASDTPAPSTNGHSHYDVDELDDVFGPLPPPEFAGAAPPGAPSSSSFDPSGRSPEMPFEDGEDDIGPMPAKEGVNYGEEYERIRAQLDAREEGKKQKREEWMVELPKKLNNYGLGARTFSKRGVAEVSTEWTETPEERRKREMTSEDEQPSTSKAFDANRDKEQQAIAQALNKDRNQSLLDMHSRKRKAEVPEPSGQRRPFDREKDMQVRGLGPSSTSEIKEKCGQLSSRFSSSNSQKFL